MKLRGQNCTYAQKKHRMLLDGDRCKVLCLSRNNELCKHKRRKKPYLVSSSAEKDLWLLWTTGWTGADSFSGLTVSAVAKRADATLWCVNENITCEIGVAAFTPFAALLPSQLEHRVQPWGCPSGKTQMRGARWEHSAKRPKGKEPDRKPNGIRTPQGWISGRAFSQDRRWSPGKDKRSLQRCVSLGARGTQACLATGGPFWPWGSGIRHTWLVTLVLAKQAVPASIAGAGAHPTALPGLSGAVSPEPQRTQAPK